MGKGPSFLSLLPPQLCKRIVVWSLVPRSSIRVPPVAIRTPRWGHSGAKMWKCVLCRACPGLSVCWDVFPETLYFGHSLWSQDETLKVGPTYKMCPCLNLLSAFSVSVWLPDVRWLSNVSFISFLWFCSSLVRSVDSDCKWRQKRSAVPCSAVGIVGISDGLSRFAANAIKISAFPIPRQNNKKYPFLWGWYKSSIAVQESADKKYCFQKVDFKICIFHPDAQNFDKICQKRWICQRPAM